MKEIKRELTSIQLRHIKVVDGDKVRYRVYRNKDEYVAVIAENALMAIKTSEIKDPYRIVRDLPTHEIAISANRLEKKQDSEEKITISTALKSTDKSVQRVEMHKKELTAEDEFQALSLGDLKRMKRAGSAIVLPEPVAAAPAPEDPHEIAFLEPPKAKVLAAARAAGKDLAPEPPAPVAAEETPLSPDQVDQLLKG